MNNNNGNVTFEKAFEEFIFFKKATNLSEESLKYYNYCFTYFTEYFPKDNPCNLITHRTVIEYINYIKETRPNLSPITLNSYIRGLRVMLYYFMELGYLSSFKMNLIKAEKKIKPTYTDQELQILLKKPDVKSCLFTEYRNWVLVNYLIGTGNRVSTVINILIKNVDFDSNVITLLKTKNRKQQIIPMSHKLAQILKEYLQYRKGKPDEYLFCNASGDMLTKYSMQDAIKRYNQKRGVSKTSIHLFRHTFAKMWILNGGDIFRLQKLLGHSSLEIVKEYVSMFGDDLQKDYELFNPLDNLANISGNKIKMGK